MKIPQLLRLMRLNKPKPDSTMKTLTTLKTPLDRTEIIDGLTTEGEKLFVSSEVQEWIGNAPILAVSYNDNMGALYVWYGEGDRQQILRAYSMGEHNKKTYVSIDANSGQSRVSFEEQVLNMLCRR